VKGLASKNKFTSDQFAKDAGSGKLPKVSWVYAPVQFDEHPPYAGKNMGNVTLGMQWTVDQVNAIVKGGLWSKTAIFITWDDWGGWYDHVTPPDLEPWNLATPVASYKGTQYRLGSRVGCLVLGPYARTGYVSKKQHSHVSLVWYCETLFALPALNQRDRQADDIADCFDYKQIPAKPPI